MDVTSFPVDGDLNGVRHGLRGGRVRVRRCRSYLRDESDQSRADLIDDSEEGGGRDVPVDPLDGAERVLEFVRHHLREARPFGQTDANRLALGSRQSDQLLKLADALPERDLL